MSLIDVLTRQDYDDDVIYTRLLTNHMVQIARIISRKWCVRMIKSSYRHAHGRYVSPLTSEKRNTVSLFFQQVQVQSHTSRWQWMFYLSSAWAIIFYLCETAWQVWCLMLWGSIIRNSKPETSSLHVSFVERWLFLVVEDAKAIHLKPTNSAIFQQEKFPPPYTSATLDYKANTGNDMQWPEVYLKWMLWDVLERRVHHNWHELHFKRQNSAG